MGEPLRLLLILLGAGSLFLAALSLARRKMGGTLCVVWGLCAFLLILAGCALPLPLLSGHELAQAVWGSLILLAAAYYASVGLSEQLRRTREMAMQVALLRMENQRPRSGPEGEPQRDALVIIPAYNEEGNIGRLLAGLRQSGTETFADILVIDDGSQDRTRQEAEAEGCLCLSGIYNQGYGAALQTGYKYALREGYSYVIQLDADGQHDVCNVAKLYQALREPDGGQTPDIVLGSRFLPGGQSFRLPILRVIGIRLFLVVIRGTTKRRITDPTTGLQGLNERALRAYAQYDFFDGACPDSNIIVQMLLAGYRIREIPAVMHARESGKSMHRGLEPAAYVLRMAFSLSAVFIRRKLLRRE